MISLKLASHGNVVCRHLLFWLCMSIMQFLPYSIQLSMPSIPVYRVCIHTDDRLHACIHMRQKAVQV